MSNHPSRTARINSWDRAAIVALGGAGCALSYDALQQMAVAIHVRGPLTYLFPLVIDGFIAYGVRALLVLRNAPFTARLYVWLLFGTATAASIWANALHAIRLNQRSPGGSGLSLDDVTVGVLSTIAPLALAGAVHLYILIARRATEDTAAGHPGQPDTLAVRVDRLGGDRLEKTGQHTARTDQVPSAPRPVTTRPETRSGNPVALAEAEPQHGGQPGADRDTRPVTRPTTGSGRPHPANPQHLADRLPVRPDISGTGPDGLLPVARRAVTDAGKTTRQVVADAIRGQGIPLSNDRLTALMAQLRAEARNLSDTAANN
jgi:hypothetical protein